MGVSLGLSPCLHALCLEDSRRPSKLLSGNAAPSIYFSSFHGEKVRFNQTITKPYFCLLHFGKPCRCSLVARVSGGSSQRESLLDGLLWLKKNDGSSSWNSDSARRLNSLNSQISAVATENYTVAEDELHRGGNIKGFEKDGKGNSKFFFKDKSSSDSKNRFEDGDMIQMDSQAMPDNDENAISQIGINKAIVQALEKQGITHLFPIQRAVFNPAMQGRDLIARAKTGTGKTLAFAIPIIHRILKEKEEGRVSRVFGRTPRALILAPTRELAKQVEKEFMNSAPSLSTLCIYGGVSITSQQRQLAQGVDVAVGTPGRVIDLIDRGTLKLSTVQFMVLDEADQMLAVGFEEDVEKIMEQLKEGHQSMLFSATMPGWVKKLSRKYLQDAITIDLVGESDEKLAEGIKLYSISTTNAAKRGILNDLIMVYGRGGKSIVFTQTKKDADEVAQALSRLVGCEALHGDITQNRRESILKSFRDGKFSVLVATDVAARGLDITDVDLIIHYEIPNDPETFVHRSGRTGRAGKQGTAILMHTQQQRKLLFRIEGDVGCKFEHISPPHVSDVLRSSSAQATAALSKVHPEVKKYFLPTAEKLLEEKGIDALAAAIAHISGFSQPPVSRSLITHEEGFMTLRIVRSGRSGSSLMSARAVMGTLAEIYPVATQNMGKICIIDEPNVEGAIFDLPEDIAKDLVTKKMTPGDSIDVPQKLPRIVEEFNGRASSYGRFSSRGGFSSRGSQDFESRSQGGRSPSRFRTQDDTFGYGSRTTLRDDRFERRFSRPADRVRSMGACFVCGQVGHIAVDCPEKRRR